MSYQIVMTMVCDGCQAKIAMAEPGTTQIDSARWDMRRHLIKTGGMEQQLYRRRTRHYCKTCADSAPAEKASSPKAADSVQKGN